MNITRFSYADPSKDISPPETAIQRAEKRKWLYATDDPVACAAIAEKLGESCRRGKTISYAELGRNISFRLSKISDGQKYVIDIQNGSRISLVDQQILDEFLCFLSLQSVKGASILASANVIDPANLRSAPNGFFETARILGYMQADNARIPGRPVDRNAEMKNLMFWQSELQKVYAWFKAH
ncbi:MAG: hypothetical protein CVU24_03305 [Betaproteobacteria bacterium HGW-Betaproteobacteria-18]|nr:MAG: hypothetical protein CVU24_03305 [Betaproteobacteria bacterium HGW-Betaproteobacteria-18]